MGAISAALAWSTADWHAIEQDYDAIEVGFRAE
jgi:hypothetical protein